MLSLFSTIHGLRAIFSGPRKAQALRCGVKGLFQNFPLLGQKLFLICTRKSARQETGQRFGDKALPARFFLAYENGIEQRVCVLRGGKVARGVANHQHMARRIALGRKRRKAGLLGACVLAQNDVHMLDKAVARPFFRQSLAVGAGNNGGVRQHMDRRRGLSAAGKRPRIIAHGGDGRVDGAAPFQRFLQARAAAGRNGFLQRRV